MEQIKAATEWLDREWLHFLVWFVVGLFVVPILLSLSTTWIDLEGLYAGLQPSTIEFSSVVFVLIPYLLYLLYRAVGQTEL